MVDTQFHVVRQEVSTDLTEISSHVALSLVVPTRNERENIAPLLAALAEALSPIATEVLFVDDSDDDTPAIIQQMATLYAGSHLAITCLHRAPGPARQGGLATAVEEGMRAARAEFVGVIDADLQHPPETLRRLYDAAFLQDADVVMASRYIAGGSYGGLDGFSRRFFSIGLKTLARVTFPAHLLRVSDPLTGFFLIRASLLEGVTLRPIGYKISLEILIRCSWTKLIEVPYAFQKRQGGASKSDARQGMLALQHMLRLLREVPDAGRFWKFGAVGASGVLVNLVLFALLLHARLPLWLAWGGATEGSLLGNFALNNGLIWRDAHARPWYLRLGRYQLVMLGSIAVSALLFAVLGHWLHPPLLAQALALVGSTAISYLLVDRWVFIPGATKAAQPAHTPPSWPWERIWRNMQLVITGVLLALAVAIISHVELGGWIVVAALLLGTSILFSFVGSVRQTVSMLLAIVTAVAAIDYITWRFDVTNWANWWIAVPLVLAEAFGVVHTLGLQVTIWPWATPRLHSQEDPTVRPVFIFIPTVNEGVGVLEPTVRATQAARDRYLAAYPQGRVTIVICNDGRVANAPDWQQMERLAQRLGVECITRTVGGGAKAGNIEHARQQIGATGDALLAIFDADQVAHPDFLIKMVAPFADPTVGWVQSGQYYGNHDNAVSRWAHDQQALFYQVLCPGKAAQNAAFICGTNVVLRAAALDAIGGLPQDSVTEDFAASITLHPSWRSIFITEELATGLGPLDLPAYLKQQRRWATGTMGVLRTHWRQIFLPQRHGLSLPQRFQYFLACTHYLCGLRDLIYIIAPLLFLLTGTPAVRGSTIGLFLWHFLPYWLASLVAFWYAGRGITGVRGVMMGFGSFPYLLESLLSVIFKRTFSFTVTSKQRAATSGWRHLTLHIGAFVACIGGLVLALVIKGRQPTSVAISVLWVIYTMTMLGGFFWLAMRDTWLKDVTFALRLPRWRLPTITLPRPALNWRSSILMGALGITIAGSVLWVHTVEAAKNVAPFTISISQKPVFGLSLPAQLLATQSGVLAQDLHTHFGIIGRTQTIQDAFDAAWANQLAAQHCYPWLTLQFGQFGAHGQPPLDASLVAIANGVHDNDLRRWASAIRDYGHPVLLTILLHVDRNWALSSAVANGGIPQDAARAWLHVQAVFRLVGTQNVAWVWSPADPAHDQLYAPPLATINAVLLSLISYPHTTWANPLAAITVVRQRYPTKPLLVEVSADGPAPQKAAWLAQVGQAIQQTHGIFALIYHEGSPAIIETAAQDRAWSLASDPRSLQVMTRLAQQIAAPSQAQTLPPELALFIDAANFSYTAVQSSSRSRRTTHLKRHHRRSAAA